LKTRAKTAARTAAVVAVPELALPADLIAAWKRSSESSIQNPPQNVVVIPPDDNPHFLRFGSDRVRIEKKRGLTLVRVERAKAITVAEILLGIGGLEAVNLWVQGYKPQADNPGTWIPNLALGKNFWDDLTAKLSGRH
jgi:hypothetical protein